MPDPIELRAGDAIATIHPDDGGRLGQLEVGGRRYLRDFEEREHAWGFWGSYPLIPWSNRIADARFRFGGRTWDLPDRWIDGTALHGLVARAAWRVTAADTHSCVETVDVDTPPWTLRCEQRFVLTSDALTQEISVTNHGDDDVPVGIGIHPWFAAGPLQVPADLIWPAVDCIPTGAPRPVTADEDLRSPVIPPTMDACYTGLTGDNARIGDLTIGWSPTARHVVVYTGEPGWVAIEPVTNANDGFNLLARGVDGTGVIVLEPAASTTMTYTFTWGSRPR